MNSGGKAVKERKKKKKNFYLTAKSCSLIYERRRNFVLCLEGNEANRVVVRHQQKVCIIYANFVVTTQVMKRKFLNNKDKEKIKRIT